MKILAGGGERFRRCIFKIPKFVLHSTIEFVWIAFALQMEFHTNCSILSPIDKQKERNGYIFFRLLDSVNRDVSPAFADADAQWSIWPTSVQFPGT